jgi:hypothetical protein
VFFVFFLVCFRNQVLNFRKELVNAQYYDLEIDASNNFVLYDISDVKWSHTLPALRSLHPLGRFHYEDFEETFWSKQQQFLFSQWNTIYSRFGSTAELSDFPSFHW